MTSASAQKSLTSRSFLGLLATQFLGAINDNMFRWLVVPIGKEIVAGEQGAPAIALSLGLASFVIPYLLLAAVAGYLADRFSKRTIIVSCKIAEVVIMGLGVLSILYGDLYVMLSVIALMGAQSALFAPSKFGSIPEIVSEKRVAAANGLIGMTTVVAIVIGTILGNLLFGATTLIGDNGELLKPAGQHRLWISAASLLGVALLGLLASLLITRLPAADPTRRFPFRFVRQTVRDLTLLGSRRALLRASLGCAVFWTLAAMAQMNVDVYTTAELVKTQFHVGILLAVLSIGVGSGSVLAGIWSSQRIELGLVPLGAAGITISGIALFAAPAIDLEMAIDARYVCACLALFFLGASAGMYNIPIQAFLQNHAPEESRGSILAANNFLAYTGMLLAAALFWAASEVASLEPGQIFLALGLVTIPVCLYVVWLLPGATARVFVFLLSKVFYRVRLEGKENLQVDGGVLLIANHVSFIDGVLLLLYLPREPRILARADPSHGRLYRRLALDLGTIFIEPGKRSLVESLETARQALESGEVVCIFPEGKMTQTGEVGEFQRGFLRVVKDMPATIVPIFLDGLWGSIFSWEGGEGDPKMAAPPPLPRENCHRPTAAGTGRSRAGSPGNCGFGRENA